MELIRIFTPPGTEDGLWSVRLNKEGKSEFDDFFDHGNDPKWLYDFFEENKTDLDSGYFGTMSVGEAVSRTIEEVQEMEDVLYEKTEQGLDGGIESLQHIFKPLNNFEYAIVDHQKSKARIRNGWVRIYAVRIACNCYIIAGGAIKLTPDMKRKHLRNELRKLDQTKRFLCSNGIDYPEDLNTYYE